jgi:transcriptional regulator with XRE-family HTH domain
MKNNNIIIIKKAIIDQHQTIYAYCKKFNLSQSNVSRFLKGETSQSFKLMEKHCANLNLKTKIVIDEGTKT